MDRTCEILVLCGSFRSDSVTRRALEVAVEGVHQAGGTAVWADRWVNHLPLYGAQEAGDSSVEGFLAAATRARGFLWGSPEYHGTCSGLLKNALDFLSFEHTEGKWAGFLATAGGRHGAQATLITLRTVARSLHLWTPPEQVSIASSHRALGADGRFADGELECKLHGLGAGLVRAIERFPMEHPGPSV